MAEEMEEDWQDEDFMPPMRRPEPSGMTPPPMLRVGSPPHRDQYHVGGFDFAPPQHSAMSPLSTHISHASGTPSHARIQSTGVDTKALSDAAFASVKMNGKLMERDLVNLHLLYSKTLASALGLLDKDLVSKVVSESGRALYLVQGSQPEPYVCFEDYCPCHYFVHKEALACKHVLAVRLSEAMGRSSSIQVSNEQYSEYLRKQAACPASNMKSPGSGNKRFKRG